MGTPDLQLQTMFLLDREGRIVSTREPEPGRVPIFFLVRSSEGCAWAVRSDVSPNIARELDNLAREEPLAPDFESQPVNASRYMELVKGRIISGPAFAFPDMVTKQADVVLVEDLGLLERNFQGWTANEIAGRSPILAVVEDGHAVSVCCCARRSDLAAEAGLETAAAFRGRGYGPRVTSAWAMEIQSSGRIPLYSTSWANEASLAVARKLGLLMYASDWSLSD